tara:strand:- start:2887 stop:3198 length:312 start_codon:yes stop_codon:yes gene_type:complete
MSIAKAAISDSATTAYTSSGSTAITSMFICNFDTSNDCHVTVYVVPSGDSADDTTTVFKELTIEAGDTYIFNTERFLFDNGDTIKMAAQQAGDLTSIISYTSI